MTDTFANLSPCRKHKLIVQSLKFSRIYPAMEAQIMRSRIIDIPCDPLKQVSFNARWFKIVSLLSRLT